MAIGDESCLGVSSDEGAELLQWGTGVNSSVDGVGGGLHWAPPASTAATAALQRRSDAAAPTFLEQETFPAVFGNTRSTFTTAFTAPSLMCNNAFPGTPAAAARDAAEVNCVSAVNCVSGLTDVLSATQISEPSHCDHLARAGATGEKTVDMEDRRKRKEERTNEAFSSAAAVGSSTPESMDDGRCSNVSQQEEESESALSRGSSPERMESMQDAGVKGDRECDQHSENVEDKEEKPASLEHVSSSMEEGEPLDEVSVSALITTAGAAMPNCDFTTWSSSCGHSSCGVTYCNLYNTTTSPSTSSSRGFFDSNASNSAGTSSSSSSSCSNNSHSSDDTDDCSGSDDDSILEGAVTSPPGVDNSRLFPNVEEVETRTGISFGRSPPHNQGLSSASSSSFTAYNIFNSNSSSPGAGQAIDGDAMVAGPTHQRHRAMELMQHSLSNIVDPDRFLRRFVLIRHNLYRLRREARDERLGSHRRRHQTSLASSPFVTPSTLLPPASSTPITTCYSSATYHGGSEAPRSNSPYPCTPTASSPYNLPGNSGMGRQPSLYQSHSQAPQGNRENVMEDMNHLLEPSPKRPRYCGAAEENKENVTYQERETYGSVGANTGSQYYQNSSGHQYSSCSGGNNGGGGGYYGSGGDQVMYGGNHYMNQNSTHYTTNNTNYFSHSQYGSNQYDSDSSNSSFVSNNSNGNNSNYSIAGASSMEVDSYNSVPFNGVCPDRRPAFSNNGVSTCFSSNGGANTGFSSNGGGNTGFSSNGGGNTGFSSNGGANTGFSSNGGANTGFSSNGGANTGFSSNGAGSTSGSFSSLIGIRSNIDTIIEHIDEQILRGSYSSSACSQSSTSSSSSPSPSTSSSSYSSPSSQQPTDCSVSQCTSSSTFSTYNHSSSTNSNSFSSYSSHYGSNSSYYCGSGGLYGQSYYGQQQYGPSPCAVTAQQQQQQPYPCGRSSSLFAGGDFRSVVYSSLLASLES